MTGPVSNTDSMWIRTPNYHGFFTSAFLLAGAMYFECKQALKPSASMSPVTRSLL